MATTLKRTDVQAAGLAGTWAHTHSAFQVAVAWSRALACCPGCGQDERPVDRDCPITTDGGNPSGDGWLPWDQQHGCGTWWGPVTCEAKVLDDENVDEVLASLVAVVADSYDAEMDRRRHEVRRRLRNDLVGFLASIDGIDSDELGDLAGHMLGSDTQPGIWDTSSGLAVGDSPHWEAWDYDPDGSGDTIAVDQTEVR